MIKYSLPENKRELKVQNVDNSYIFQYPCDDLKDCTYYEVTLSKGTYAFEVWGAEGGHGGGIPGKGGYSSGIMYIPHLRNVYLYIGAKGTAIEELDQPIEGSWNGGGRGYCAGNDRKGSSGGGGTDIRFKGTTEYHRIIVAGGGGGSHNLLMKPKTVEMEAEFTECRQLILLLMVGNKTHQALERMIMAIHV